MSLRSFAHLSAVALFALSLAACGGGGSGSSAVPAVEPVAALPAGTDTPPPLIPATTASVPTHIPVWAFDEYNFLGANAPSWAVQKYVTYAGGGYNNAKAQSDCNTSPKSCYSVYYVDPNFLYATTNCPNPVDGSFISASSENWWVHRYGYTDSTHRVHGSYTKTCNGVTQTFPVYLANAASPGVQTHERSYLQSYGDAWDYYWMDDTKSTVIGQGYGPGGGFCPWATNSYCTTTQEYQSDSAVVAAHGSFASAMVHKNGSPMMFFFNGVAVNATRIQNLNIFASSSHYAGAICENCIVNVNTIRPALFAEVLTAMAQTNAIPGAKFVLLDRGNQPAGSAAQIAQRTAELAEAWIGFAPGHTVVFPDFEYSTHNLASWPEDMIYPTLPKQSMSTAASDVAVTTGVYRREFAACYNAGSAIGQCAALINSTGYPVAIKSAWLTQAYGHVLSLSGGDILSGGTVKLGSVAFTANSTTIPAGQGILLVR